MQAVNLITHTLQSLADPKRAEQSQKFCGTGKGEYGEGDVFIGVTVPQQRNIAQQYWKDITLDEIIQLLQDPIHEYRLTALFLLTLKYQKSKNQTQKQHYINFFLQHIDQINNRDLVDSCAHKLLGDWLLDKDRKILYQLAKSGKIRRQRIAIVATRWFIRAGEYEDTLKISQILLDHPHHLIHKAVGWMLREVGKKDKQVMMDFLEEHASKMPRIMLSYAIEKLSKKEKVKLRGL